MSVRFALVFVATLVILCVAPTGAEVSTDPVGAIANTIIMGTITEDPEPIGTWISFRQIPTGRILNPSGAARGDGNPDLRFTGAQERLPIAVWSYNAGTDHDIAFAEWDGNEWGQTAFLTSSTDEELSPRLAVEGDGTVHVVWWVAGASEQVFLTTRPAGASTWDPPLLLTGPSGGRRPSITVGDGVVRVAYERTSLAGGYSQDLMVSTMQPDQTFAHELVRSTIRPDRLDARIHSESGHLWVEWRDDEVSMGCAEWSGSTWASIDPQPLIDPSWVGLETARKLLRSQVLNP